MSGCPSTTGVAMAASTAESMLNLIAGTAQSTLAQAMQASVDLGNIRFDDVDFRVDFDPTGQLAAWVKPDRPELDYSLLDVAASLDPPGDIELDDLRRLNIGDGPDFSDTVPAKLIDLLIDMMSGLSGLPPEWEEAMWNRGRDRLYREQSAKERQVAGEFSRRGWTMPVGVEVGRLDDVRFETWQALSGLNRDILIKAWEEALASLRAAAQLALQYLQAWVDAFRALIQAESEESNRILQQNDLRIKKLQARIAVFEARANMEKTRLGSVAQAFQTEATIYGADLGVADALSRRDAAAFQAETQRRTANADKQIENNRIEAATRDKDIQETINNQRTRADVLRQVCAALWQSLNVGASMSASSSRSEGTSCSTQYEYRGEI